MNNQEARNVAFGKRNAKPATTEQQIINAAKAAKHDCKKDDKVPTWMLTIFAFNSRLLTLAIAVSLGWLFIKSIGLVAHTTAGLF